MKGRTVKAAVMMHVLEGLFALLILIGLFLGWQKLQLSRREAQEAERMIDIAPQILLQQEGILTELKKQEARLNRLAALLPARGDISDVVARIESEAGQHNVRVVVPDVKEEVRRGKDNKPIPQTGEYIDVRLTVQGYGDPMRLLAFLYAIEHFPYVLKIPDWEITTEYLVLPADLTVSAPAGAEEETAARPAGLLEAGVVLTIAREL